MIAVLAQKTWRQKPPLGKAPQASVAFCAQKPISAVLLACPVRVNVPIGYKQDQFEWLFGVGRRDDRVMNLGKRRLLFLF